MRRWIIMLCLNLGLVYGGTAYAEEPEYPEISGWTDLDHATRDWVVTYSDNSKEIYQSAFKAVVRPMQMNPTPAGQCSGVLQFGVVWATRFGARTGDLLYSRPQTVPLVLRSAQNGLKTFQSDSACSKVDLVRLDVSREFLLTEFGKIVSASFKGHMEAVAQQAGVVRVLGPEVDLRRGHENSPAAKSN